MVRFATTIGWRVTLETYAPWPGPFYIGLTGAFWSLTGLVLFWGFLIHASWTRLALLIGGYVYAIWFWVDRLFVQSQIRANWLFDLLSSIILMGFATAVVLDPKNQIYFIKRDK